MAQASTLVRVNVGCGASPTPGWVNLDNSLTVRLARLPIVGAVLSALPERGERTRFVRRARTAGIQWATASRLPFRDGAIEAIYTSHMVEHLPRAEADAFFREAHRVLRKGGAVRVSVPDLRRLVDGYLRTRDADAFIESTLLSPPTTPTLSTRIRDTLVGHRCHIWMYDEESLSAALIRAGFTSVRGVPPGETRIAFPEPLDLWERAEESIYVEGTRA